MEDKEIILLFNNRNENAIKETDKKYRGFCYSISFNILADREDAEECLNDTYYAVWNSIPPHCPTSFPAYIGKITRFTSLKKLREKKTLKRGGKNAVVAFDELSDCISDNNLIEIEIEQKELAATVNFFIKNLPALEQKIFICRYWYFDSIDSISKQFNISIPRVKSMLFRIRKRLKTKLKEVGVFDGNK